MEQTSSTLLNHWGLYQFLLQIVAIPCQIFGCAQDLVYSFTFANPKFRCKYDWESDNATYAEVLGLTNWSRLFETESQGGFDVYCKLCPEMVANGSIQLGTCGSNYSSQSCDSYIYDYSQYTSSVAMTYDLVCESGAWKQQLAETLMMVGNVLGAGLWGWMADRYGRKRAYMVCTFGLIVSTNIQPFLPSFELLALFQVVIGLCNSGPLTIMFIILMEYSSRGARSAVGNCYQMCYSVGYIILGTLAYLIRDWKRLMWASSLTNTLYIATYFVVPESYSWLAGAGRITEAKAEIKRMCRINKITIADDILESELKMAGKSDDGGNSSIKKMLKYRRTAVHTAIILYFSFAVAFSYFGVALNTDDLPGNLYLNFILMGAVEVIGYGLAIPLMDKLGRVPCLAGFMIIGGVSLVASGILPRASTAWLIVTLAIIAKIFISAGFSVSFNYVSEYFPTMLRSSANGLCNLVASVGSVCAPQIQLLTVYTARWIPFVIYGLTALSAGLLAFLLPETKGKQLPQTIEDALQNSRRQTTILPDNELTEKKHQLS